MKFLGSFIVLALLNLVSVFAGPPPHEYIKDSDFEYFIQYDGSNQAYITNVLNKRATTLYINPYVYYNNVKYDVVALTGGLTDSAVTKLVIPHYIYNDFSVWGNVLGAAKKLKEIQINSLNNVYFYEDSFAGVNENVQIHGQGVDNTIKLNAKRFLRDNYPELIRDYSRTSGAEKRCAFYQIARIVNKNWTYYKEAHGGRGSNGVSTFFLRRGSMHGLARVNRYLAVAAGLSEFSIQVGGDGINYGFNYVAVSGGWKILDPASGDFSSATCTDNAFITIKNYAASTNGYYGRLYKSDPDSYVIFNGKYACPNENISPLPESENFKQWVAKNGRGTPIAV